MKIVVLAILILITSCSSHLRRADIKHRSNDVLANESLLRYSKERIDNLTTQTNYKLYGVLKCHQNEFNEGFENLKSLLNSKRNDPEYWNHIGNCFYLQKNYLKAEFFYKLSITTAKQKKISYAAAYNNLGVLYQKQNNYQDALENFKIAVKIAPNSKTPRYNLSLFYIQFGMIQNAITHLKYLHKQAPLDVDLLSALGTLHLMRNSVKQSIYYFSQIESKYLTRSDIAAYYSLAAYLSGDIKKAQQLLSSRQTGQFKELDKICSKLRKLINERT